jgi:hypothetical protein
MNSNFALTETCVDHTSNQPLHIASGPASPQKVLARKLTQNLQTIKGIKNRRTEIWGSNPVESIYIPGNWALFAEVINTDYNDLSTGPLGEIGPHDFSKEHGCTYKMVFIGAADEGLLTIAHIYPALKMFGHGHTGRGVDACVSCAPELTRRLMNTNAANFFAIFTSDPLSSTPTPNPLRGVVANGIEAEVVEVSTVTVNIIETVPNSAPRYIFAS